jgi:hypothetical protein
MHNKMISRFPVSTPAYPWDLLDEGVDAFLDGVIEHIGANTVFTPLCYYMEEGSAFWWGAVMPHNRKIRRYFPEDGLHYFTPDPEFFHDTCIKPDRSKDPLLEGFDAIEALQKPLSARGMKLSVWFPLFKNPYLARKYPDCTPVDIFGGRQKHGLCPNNPNVRGYVRGIIRNVIAKYSFASIGLDKFGIEYWAGGPQGEGWYNRLENGPQWSQDVDPVFLLLNAPCFCEHCSSQARQWGYDWDLIRQRVAELANGFLARKPSIVFELSKKGYFDGEEGIARLILEEPAIYQWLRFKMQTLTSVAAEIKSILKQEAPAVKLSAGLDPPVRQNFQRFRHYGWLYGSSYRDVAGVVDGIGIGSGWSLEEKYYCAMLAKEAIGGRCDWGLDVHAVSPADPDYVRKQVELYNEMGMTNFVVFGYTWAPLENLWAARDALRRLENTIR